MVHLPAVPIGSAERPLGVAAFVNDVSEMHRVESVRRDFVANVSHELKTPIGALEVLAETLVGEDDPGGHRGRSPSASCKEAERLARIVDDLLDLSLIETQESPPREPVPLELLVDDAVDQVRPAAAAAGDQPAGPPRRHRRPRGVRPPADGQRASPTCSTTR